VSKYKIIEKGTYPHYCKKPGGFKQWVRGLADYSVIQCKECDTYWELQPIGDVSRWHRLPAGYKP